MPKHTILFLAANPLGTARLELDEEARAIRVALERSRHRDQFQLEVRGAARPLDLLDELRKLRPTVVHLSGHGTSDAAGARRNVGGSHRYVVAEDTPADLAVPGLYFQDADGRPELVSAEALAQMFGAAGSSVKLVVLNACYTDAHAEALLAYVDCVVGVRGVIGDHAARSFAIGFYGGLGERQSVAAAYRQGCAAIGQDGLPDGDKPQLSVRPGVDAAQVVLAAPTGDSPAAGLHNLVSPPTPAYVNAEVEALSAPAEPDVATDREEGRSGSRTRLTRDSAGEKACLNANEYADALADVLADAAGEICFALLGHWGRGKTYLAALVDRKLPARYGRVWFSAWKYRSRPELWAHLHESFYAAQMHDAWWRRVPRLFRANLHKHGVLPLVVMFIGAGIAAVPLGSLLRLALLLLGAIGAIRGALLFFKQRAPVAATLRRFLAVNRHTEKLGLQAAIGVDLESLVIGWAGRLRWSRARIVLSAIGYLAGVAALLGGLWLGFHPTSTPPIPKLPWLTWDPPPVVAWTVLGVVAGLSVALPVWLLAAGRSKNRLLLVVDDLDRMPSGEMLEIVESLKLFLENGAMRETVQLFLICEEEALRRALADKYGETTRAVEENLQKLFIAHLRLPPLSPSEQEEVLTHVIGAVANPAPQITDAATDTAARPGPPPAASVLESPARVATPPAPLATAADASEFTDDDRRALRKGLRRLGGANSTWAALGPRAIQSYVLRYKLARRLLVARGARVLPERLAVLLAERMHAGSDGARAGSEMIEAVIAEVA